MFEFGFCDVSHFLTVYRFIKQEHHGTEYTKWDKNSYLNAEINGWVVFIKHPSL